MVPNGWVFKELAEICSKPISYGIVQTGPAINKGVPCVRVVDLNKQELKTCDMILTSQDIHQSYRKTILQKHELIMALRGEIGLIRIVEDNLVGINITRGIARLAPKINEIDPTYLLWAMRSSNVKNDLMRKAGGSALQEIALTALRKVKVPVPPLPEQRKIAKILSTWDKAICTTESLIDNSKQQKKALIQQLLTGKKRLLDDLGKPFEGEWREGRIRELIGSLDAGVSVNSEDDNNPNSEFKILKTSAVSEGIFKPLETKSVLEKDDIIRLREPVIRDTIIISRMNTPNLVGANAYTYEGYSNTYLPDRLWQAKARVRNVNMRWLAYWFGSSLTRSTLSSLATGTSGSMKNITKSDVLDLKINIPHFEEQCTIARVLESSDSSIRLLNLKLAALKNEKKALMQQLLTGKRRVKIDDKEVA